MNHGKSLDEAEASFFAELQTFLSSNEKPLARKLTRICAVDAAYDGDQVAAVATLLLDGRMAEQATYFGHCTFPYVSGLFYLREGPPAVEAVRRLKTRPQLVCFDAHGRAHPRSAGLATVCGIVLGIPSIGMAKSPLLVGAGKGAMLRDATYKGKTVGFVTGSGGGARYWSPGFSVSMGELESLSRDHGSTCLEAMAESHRRANLEIGWGEHADRPQRAERV